MTAWALRKGKAALWADTGLGKTFMIERCVQLWSNRGETVFSPFAGIGSEGHEAVRLDRQFIGVELKKEYFEAAVRNLKNAKMQIPLFAAEVGA